MSNNKIILNVKRDQKTQYFYFWKWNKRVTLCWDLRKDWFWLEQAANACWKENFMRDLRDILDYMADNNFPIFSLYELPEIIHWTIEN